VVADSESEFGVIGGLEPAILLRRIRISMPVNADYLFTAPHPFITFSLSLNAGVVF
jgi:hypothetical protein